MPTGGLQIYAGGLQLQAVTPGLSNQGNFHISGKGIAETGFSTTIDTNGTESMGHKVPVPANYISNQNNVFYGAQITTGTGLVGPFVALGSQLRASGQGCVAVGLSCLSGVAGSNGLPNWAIGSNCSAGTTSGAYSLAIGWSNIANGGQNIAIGKNVTCNTTNTGVEDAIAIGSQITAGINATKNILVGFTIAPTGGKNNVLAVGWYDPVVGNYPAAGPGAIDNSMVIGNPAQTAIQLGSLTLTKQTVTGAKGGNAALGSLLSALSAMGLINDTTTA